MIETLIGILIIILVIALIAAGIIGIFLPFLPDVPFILLGAFVYGLYDGFEHIGFFTYLALIILALFVAAVDYLSTLVGAKKFGASKYGIIGGVIGAILGLMIGSLLGFLIGFFIGATLGELLSGRDMKKSLKSGSGAILGFLGGTLVKIFIALTMIVIFLLAVFL